MSTVGLAVFAAIIVVASSQGGPYCDPNKGLKYTDCVRCKKTCNDYWYNPGKACALVCQPGCDCADPNSYIRNDGVCVPSNYCFAYCNCNTSPRDSGPSETVPVDTAPVEVIVVDVPVNNVPVESVPVENSPGIHYCDPNKGQEYSDCVRCKRTCNDYWYNPNKVCGLGCQSGCQCADPNSYIRNDGYCVRSDYCFAYCNCNAAAPSDSATDDIVTDDIVTDDIVTDDIITDDIITDDIVPDQDTYYCDYSKGQIYSDIIPCYNTCSEYLNQGACGLRGPGCTCVQNGYYIRDDTGQCVPGWLCQSTQCDCSVSK